MEDPHFALFYHIVPISGIAFSDHNVSRFAVHHVEGVRQDLFMCFI